MIHRTIAAALLVGLASPVLAGTAFDLAAGMAAGKNANTTYDGSTVRTAVRAQVAGALTTGGLAVETPPTTRSAARPTLTMTAVPEPAQDPLKGKDLTKLPDAQAGGLLSKFLI